jgi:hypothetical protein
MHLLPIDAAGFQDQAMTAVAVLVTREATPTA